MDDTIIRKSVVKGWSAPNRNKQDCPQFYKNLYLIALFTLSRSTRCKSIGGQSLKTVNYPFMQT